MPDTSYRFLSFRLEYRAGNVADVLMRHGIDADVKELEVYSQENLTRFYDVYIDGNDVDRAFDIISRDPEVCGYDEIEDMYDDRCTRCGSVDVVRKKLSLPLYVLSLMTLGAVFLAMSDRYSCGKCHHEWAGKNTFWKLFPAICVLILSILLWCAGVINLIEFYR